ncbi:MAG: hypothetical protein IJI65_02580 [Lachnospiraceae bacterium]|nr:hypothetical protein [Lachnospiraceae bacterium]
MRYYNDYSRKNRLIAAGLIAAGCLAFIGFNYYQKWQDKKAVEQHTSMGFTKFSDEEYEESLKIESSDIEGMTKYDKLQAGLYITEGSDTDHDGLTDKEEIEIYGSDPLKISTSGDLYTDGFKAANGMDLSRKYEHEGEVEFVNNHCGEISLAADDALDPYAVVSDVTASIDTGTIRIDKLYKAYRLYNYSGSISIDPSKALPDKVDLKDVKIKIFKGAFIDEDLGKLEDISYKEENDRIALNYTFENTDTYYILITGKTTFAATLASLTGAKINGAESEDGLALMISLALIGNATRFQEGTVFLYSEMSDIDSTYALRDAFIDRLNSREFEPWKDPIVTRNSKNLKAVSRSEIILKYNLLKKLFPSFEHNDKTHLHHFILSYCLYNYEDGTVIAANGISGNNGDKTERLKFKNYHTTFDQYTDELCFQNFQSEYTPNGNCLGIAHFTSYLFNNKTYPSTGSYGDITWDLTTDKENQTLMDEGIFDYKDIHFIDDRTDKDNDYLRNEVLSSGEKEFVKMIAAGLKEGNDLIDVNSHIKINGELNDYSALEKAMTYLDEGKLVNVGLTLNDGTGHAITLYDYYWLDDESVNFRVYDSNIPQNDRENYYIHADGACYLQCAVVTQPNGEKDFQYIYRPLEHNTYYLSSSAYFIMQKYCIVIFDENWNEFN